MSNRKAPEGLMPPIMQHHRAFNDSELVIWQANLKNCGKRLKSLAKEAGTLRRPPDVIAVQDPPPDMPWNSIRSYEMFYNSERPLREEDKPQNRARGKPAVRLSHVCFFVHRSIPGDTYEVEYHTGANKDLAASLYLQTPNAGTLAIHNVYNKKTAVDIEALIRDTTTTGRDILVGDFNLSHEHWGGVEVEDASKDARNLHHGLQAARMTCVTVPGTTTFTRGVSGKGSTIDLTLISDQIIQRWTGWQVLDVLGFESDHRVIETRLSLKLARTSRIVFQWRRTDEEAFAEHVEAGMDALGCPSLDTKSDIDACIENTCRVLESAIKKHVPTRVCESFKPTRRPVNGALRRLKDEERMALQKLRQSNNHRWHRFWSHCNSKRIAKERSQNKNRWRRSTAANTKYSRGAYRMAKMATVMCQPKEPAHLPVFEVNNTILRTKKEKELSLRNSTWPETSDGEAAPSLPKPSLDPKRPQLSAEQSVSTDEVDEIIKRISSGKAPGPDQIANEAIKKARVVLAPLLARVFDACLRLGYHPCIFKHATTVILRKPGKKTYNHPKSWRPIALLPCLGKILERILADRLKDLAMKNNLLPHVQFGLPGKCTTKALQYLLNPIYAAWCSKRRLKATLLGLDIAGAFDNVDRSKLLQ